jgi:hypothetical protein
VVAVVETPIAVAVILGLPASSPTSPAGADGLRRHIPYSVDYYLEQKVSCWWKVAEVRRPAERLSA